MAIAEREALMTAREAAEYLGLRPQTLAIWRCDARHLPYIKCGRSVRYKLSDLEQFVESRTIQAGS